MTACPMLVVVLWSFYEAWRDNGFKDVDADGATLRPRPSLSRMRRVKDGDLGTRMSLMNDYKQGSMVYAEGKDRGG
jgi:hypothetical protein